MTNRHDLVAEFGRELISAREYKGISLEQIAEATKISRRYLDALERGEWDALPQPYMEAFLKAYAETAGMNLPKVIKQFRDLRRHLAATEGQTPELEEEAEPAPTQPPQIAEEKRRTFPLYFIIVAAGLIIAAVAAYWFIVPKPAPDLTEELHAPAAKTQSRAESRLPTSDTLGASPSHSDSALSAVDSSLVVRALPESLIVLPKDRPLGVNLVGRARQRCWLRATLDKEKINEALLAPGDTIALVARDEVQLIIGNAGGLELEMDGASLGTLGPFGRAVTIVITPDGIVTQRLGKPRIGSDSSGTQARQP